MAVGQERNVAQQQTCETLIGGESAVPWRIHALLASAAGVPQSGVVSPLRHEITVRSELYCCECEGSLRWPRHLYRQTGAITAAVRKQSGVISTAVNAGGHRWPQHPYRQTGAITAAVRKQTGVISTAVIAGGP